MHIMACRASKGKSAIKPSSQKKTSSKGKKTKMI